MLVPLLLAIPQFVSPVASTPSNVPVSTSTLAATCSAEWLPTFGPFQSLDAGVETMEVFDDGSGPALYLGGEFHASGATILRGVARWNGSSFAPLGAGLNNGTLNVLDLAVHDAGSGPRLYACGEFLTGGGVAEWNGTSWSALGSGLATSFAGVTSRVYSMASYDDGTGPSLYVTGLFDSAGGIPVNGYARWDGNAWSAVANTPSSAYCLVVFDDGSGPQLYAGGSGVWRYGPGGWTNLTGGSLASIHALLVLDLGSGPQLYAAGDSDVLRWNGTSWIPTLAGFSFLFGISGFDDGSGMRLYAQAAYLGEGRLLSWNGTGPWRLEPGVMRQGNGLWAGAPSLHAFDDGSGNRLFVGGTFASIDNAPAANFARFDGTSWRGSRVGIDGPVRALTTFDDGTGEALIVGGDFTSIEGAPDRRCVARWDGEDWSALGSGLTTGFVYALETFDDGSGRELYAGGAFTEQNRIARWDGAGWALLGTGITSTFPEPRVFALKEFDDGGGNRLFVGGNFTTAGGVAASNIAKWNGTSWSAVGGGVTGTNSAVYALEVFDDGTGPKLYAAGRFTHAGPFTASSIARWNGTSWSALSPGVTLGEVSALAVFDGPGGPNLYAGGLFNQIAGLAANSIARWSGTSWSTLNGLGGGNWVRSLHVFDDGTGDALFAGGYALTGNALLAKWDNAAWTTLAPGSASISVDVLATFDGGTSVGLIAGGNFPAAPSGDARLALYGCRPWQVDVFCAGDGTATACPCANPGAVGNGCASSINPNGATLSFSGTASVSADDFVLVGSGMPNAACLYFQGTSQLSGGSGLVLGDGLRCASGVLRRLGTRTNVAGSSSYPGVGDPSIVVAGAIPAGGGVSRAYQGWYRNSAAFCTPSTFNLTNGLWVVWAP